MTESVNPQVVYLLSFITQQTKTIIFRSNLWGTLRKVVFHFLSNWMEHDRGDIFPLYFEPNWIPFGSKSKENCHHECERKWNTTFLSVVANTYYIWCNMYLYFQLTHNFVLKIIAFTILHQVCNKNDNKIWNKKLSCWKIVILDYTISWFHCFRDV